ncbi:MAG: hypothetical protein KC910_32860, partial [Candidatus Eremiobacteraeota bacterium]|nr:hypothetical protein [Candidatus Eremiobacteraeota bacterium]
VVVFPASYAPVRAAAPERPQVASVPPAEPRPAGKVWLELGLSVAEAHLVSQADQELIGRGLMLEPRWLAAAYQALSQRTEAAPELFARLVSGSRTRLELATRQRRLEQLIDQAKAEGRPIRRADDGVEKADRVRFAEGIEHALGAEASLPDSKRERLMTSLQKVTPDAVTALEMSELLDLDSGRQGQTEVALALGQSLKQGELPFHYANLMSQAGRNLDHNLKRYQLTLQKVVGKGYPEQAAARVYRLTSGVSDSPEGSPWTEIPVLDSTAAGRTSLWQNFDPTTYRQILGGLRPGESVVEAARRFQEVQATLAEGGHASTLAGPAVLALEDMVRRGCRSDEIYQDFRQVLLVSPTVEAAIENLRGRRGIVYDEDAIQIGDQRVVLG